eukprot:gnl/Trimastix_PCT/2884.p1 GENE.gnl/Trimastix_PCT/2884~~gnl/Trimastix_PCT/2884.p1  ORF type:complete len:626 (-),score=216.20 gnl/Trimastix_PCT/2884:75-1952(-)
MPTHATSDHQLIFAVRFGLGMKMATEPRNIPILARGAGERIGWHDPDEHRRFIAEKKSRALHSKLMTASEAVSQFVEDGQFVALGGFGHVRVPMNLVYEIIRQRKRNLAVAGKTAVHDLDILIGAGCVDRVECAYSFGHELRGLSPASRRHVQDGRTRVVAETTNASLQWRFLAGMMGIPFIPARNLMGTDTFEKSSAIAVEDPFSRKPVALIPSANPDVVLIHVPRCDKYGNCQIDGIAVEDIELARAARRLIVTTEEIVEHSEIQAHPWRTSIPFYCVDAVVHQAYASHPCEMPYMYFFDEAHIAEWLRLSRSEAGATEYFEKYVYGVPDFNAYLELVGGEALMAKLRDIEHMKIPMEAPWLKPKTEPQLPGGYTGTELLATTACNALVDSASVFVGTGLPMIATMLAQRTHAPNLLLIFEAGGIRPTVPTLPISVGDSRTFFEASAASTMHDVMAAAQAGFVDYGFLGAAQMDQHGNLNTTFIGRTWDQPKTRLPGSGGANDLASFCHKIIVIMRQDRLRFVEKLDFLTTPGYLDGAGSRERHGLPEQTGPYRVITQLGVYDFNEQGCMRLCSIHPGVTIEEIRENSSFEIDIPENVPTSAIPTAEEQRILREIDPAHIVIG